MNLHLQNTLGHAKQKFTPINPKEVGIYACGITLYDHIHVGHLKSVLSVEILKNYLEHTGLKVKLVRNITDIDDKIIDRAVKAGVPPMEYVQGYINHFHTELDAFGFSRDYVEPRVSEYLPQIGSFITDLINKGNAYSAKSETNSIDGQDRKDVYFKVSSDIGINGKYELSGKKVVDMQSQGRVLDKGNKENNEDFALWKSDKTFGWESQWGQGRPGWHIECSVMHFHTLGEHFDIHAGGRDLVFPHHENEINQSKARNGVNPANVWFHNGVVKVKALDESGKVVDQKLSKSLGNSVYTRDLRTHKSVEAIKLFLNMARPTSDQYYEDSGLESAQKLMDKIYRTVNEAQNTGVASESLDIVDEVSYKKQFEASLEYKAIIEAFDDNLNTPEVMAQVHAILQKPGFNLVDSYGIYFTLQTLAVNAHNLSFTQFLKLSKEKTLELDSRANNVHLLAPAHILELAQQRWNAKEEKNWGKADEIKKRIISEGWSVEDSPEGWKIVEAKNSVKAAQVKAKI